MLMFKAFHSHQTLDRIGMTVSGLCGVHCAMLPLVFVALPSLQAALYSFRNPDHDLAIWFIRIGRWEWLVVCTAIAVAAASMALAYRHHHRFAPLAVAACGAASLIAAIWGPGAHDLTLHTGFAVSGGMTMCIAHLLSLRMTMRVSEDCTVGESAKTQTSEPVTQA
jgi:hypothetical protein